jgi:hypothetical protein
MSLAIASLIAAQRFGRYRVQTRHRATIAIRSLLTHSDRLRPSIIVLREDYSIPASARPPGIDRRSSAPAVSNHAICEFLVCLSSGIRAASARRIKLIPMAGARDTAAIVQHTCAHELIAGSSALRWDFFSGCNSREDTYYAEHRRSCDCRKHRNPPARPRI